MKPKLTATLQRLGQRCRNMADVAGDYHGHVQTSILLIHGGRATSYNEQIELTNRILSERFRLLPETVSRAITNIWLTTNGQRHIERAVDECAESMADTRDGDRRLALKLSATLDYMLPELGPFDAQFGYKFIGDPTIDNMLHHVHKKSPKRVLVLPFYSHYWCFNQMSCVNELSRHLHDSTISGEKNKRLLVRGDEDYHQSASSYELIDRLNTHPFVSDLWASRIERVLTEQVPSDVMAHIGVLFLVPQHRFYAQRRHDDDIRVTCSRVIDRLGNRHPYDIGYYNQPTEPGMLTGRQSYPFAMSRLSAQGVRNLILVPITILGGENHLLHHVRRSLENDYLLRLVRCEQIYLCEPSLTVDDDLVLTGLCELIRNYLLGNVTQPHGQWRLKCPNCFRRDCRRSRQLFMPETNTTMQM